MKAQDIQDLQALIEFLKSHQVAEFELDRGDEKIRLKFAQPEHVSPSLAELAKLLAGAPSAVAHTASAQTSSTPIAATVSIAAAADPNEGLHVVKSPIVGTYYGSPSPGSAPFVSVGEKVEKGKVLCIIEAMKLMNEIESDAAGEVVRCFAVNGQPIEFGQPLFALRV
jgi:acetyl-CoA carboxylase biotin carboxyl carrier protein